MANEVKKGTLFVKQVVARLKGDDNAELAAKIGRKAISAVEGQIAALKAKEVDDEDNVEDAQEALNNAKYPTTMITNNKSYCDAIVYRQQVVTEAEEVLKQTKESIAFFEGLLTEF